MGLSSLDLFQVKDAVVDASASGATALVAAVTGKRIVLLQFACVANGTVNIKFQSASTDLSKLFYLVANVGFVLPLSSAHGWCRTAIGEALNLNLSGAVAVGGLLSYIEVG